jgi:hypothetical protein
MIVASFGRYLAISVRDHETAGSEERFLEFMAG